MHSSKSASHVNRTHSESSSKYLSWSPLGSSMPNRLVISLRRSLYLQLFCIRNLIFSSPCVTFTRGASSWDVDGLLFTRGFSDLGFSATHAWLWDLGMVFSASLDKWSSGSLLILFTALSTDFSCTIRSSLPTIFKGWDWGDLGFVPDEQHWLELELRLLEEEGDLDASGLGLVMHPSCCVFKAVGCSFDFESAKGLILDAFGEANSGKFE